MARKLTGVRRKRGKWQAFVRVHAVLPHQNIRVDDVPLETMRAWRDEQKRRFGTVSAAPGGSFADDIAKYLARHATMPTLAQRTVHLEIWARELGRDRTSDSITGDEIIAIMNRWARTPTIGKGRRGRPSAPEGLSPATRRKRRTALQSFFAANGPGGYNPVKTVPMPETPKPEARHLDFGTIARIVAQMPDERSVKPGEPRQMSLAGIRVQVLRAYRHPARVAPENRPVRSGARRHGRRTHPGATERRRRRSAHDPVDRGRARGVQDLPRRQRVPTLRHRGAESIVQARVQACRRRSLDRDAVRPAA